MDDLKLIIINQNEITTINAHEIDVLAVECFPDVTPQQNEEHFYAKEFARILVYDKEFLVGHVKLFSREIEYHHNKINLGGMGAVCVKKEYRGRGIATEMLRNGLEILSERGCDIACLNVDTRKETYKLYESVGFTMLKKNISFEDSHGKIIYDDGTMFIPLHSRHIYDEIMKGKNTFHYGKGYW